MLLRGGDLSRYLYLPSTAFALTVGTALTRLAAGPSSSRPQMGLVVYALIVAFVAVRFGQFYAESIRSQVNWTQTWRPCVQRVVEDARRDGDALRVVSARDPDGNDLYVEPTVRWVRRDHTVRVVVER